MFLLQTQEYAALSSYLYDFRNVAMGDMSQAAFLSAKGLNFTFYHIADILASGNQ